MRQQLVVSRELRLYDENTGLWRALEPMEVPRYQHGVALLGGFLFIVGGQSRRTAPHTLRAPSRANCIMGS